MKEIIRLSRLYGKDPDYVLAGGGNTSLKDENHIYVKASGTSLAGMKKDGFVKLGRKKLDEIGKKKYSEDPLKREEQVKADLYAAVAPGQDKRPSVETSLHNLLGYKYVVHLHPWLVNGLMCAKNALNECNRLFSKDALFVPYTDPGYTLFKLVEEKLNAYRKAYNKDAQILFLQSHGIFVGADEAEEIEALYAKVMNTLAGEMKNLPPADMLPIGEDARELLPAIRMILSTGSLKVLRTRNNELIQHYCQKAEFKKVEWAYTPDVVVYCKGRAMLLDGKPEKMLKALPKNLEKYEDEHGYLPRVLFAEDVGMIAVAESPGDADTILDVYEDQLKAAWAAKSFGGPVALKKKDIQFIDNWEVENYRRKVAAGQQGGQKMKGRVAIVTGSAQGFGAGLAEGLYAEGANVVVSDISRGKGKKMAKKLNKLGQKNQALFQHCDVSDPVSAEKMVEECVLAFGGLDLLVSNAGVLIAGSLEEMDPGDFDFVTRINYNGYYYCTRAAVPVMKLQQEYKEDHYTDIVQINSKSGLKGSNKNFAYAGGKFGGIGLTQSFALELAPYRIKVNAICPGNLFDGPLWSDPENGLFAQYLRTGKVPGAKNIEDVRKHYEEQAPLKRGTEIEDVLKALYYLIEQKFETGQAVPVTGGQSMLH